MNSSDDFWDRVSAISFTNEPSVDMKLIVPLLHSLGYEDDEHISPQYPVVFREGRRGRKPAADFVVFAERPHSRASSLIVIETKRPGEKLTDAKKQAESYVANVGAPLFVVTDGEHFEVWQYQPTAECECLVSCSTQDLLLYRGQIESVLALDAAKALSKSLVSKNFGVAAKDLFAYEYAEYEREPLVSYIIARRVTEKGHKREVGSADLLETFDTGAVITAPSGYGKTSLVQELLRQAIEQRWLGQSQRLPIEVFLPDAPTNEREFRKFLWARVAAHCPQFSEAAMAELLRECGVTLFCDGFDRVPYAARSGVETVLEIIRRDYPKCQVFVFTRGSTLPERLSQKALELCELNHDEQDRLIERFWAVHPQTLLLRRFDAPAVLRALWRYPLLLRLSLEAYRTTGRLPSEILPLFKNWLERIVPTSVPLQKRVDMTSILELVASKTTTSPLSESAIVALVQDRGFSGEALQGLVDNDAFSKNGDTLEIRHEALADYLRAVKIARLSPENAGEELGKLTFGSDSHLAPLLMEAAQTADMHALIWRTVTNESLSAAIASLRYRGDISTTFPTDADQRSIQYLKDVMDGIQIPLLAHFSSLSTEVCSWLAGQKTQHISISGGIGTNAESVTYSFVPSDSWENSPSLGRAASSRRSFGRSLKLSGLRLDSGRLVGMMHLRDALVGLIDERRLKGGLIWKEEQIVSRLRHLVKHHGVPQNSSTNLAEAAKVLRPHAGKVIGNTMASKGQMFEIDELIDDIRTLMDHGIADLKPWSQSAYPIDVSSETGKARLSNALHEHYRRVQLAYCEVVQQSFPALRNSLTHFQVFPIRYDLEIELQRKSPTESPELEGMEWKWLPVRTFDEAGADVVFIDTRRGGDHVEAMERYEQLRHRRFVQYGRENVAGFFTWGSSADIPDFAGKHGYGYGDGKRDESSVISAVVRHLTGEITGLFSELAHTDKGMFQQM